MSVNSDDSESRKLNAKVTQKVIRNIIWSNFTSWASNIKLLEKDIRLLSSTVYWQWAQRMKPTVETKKQKIKNKLMKITFNY